jgi:hypothetical protein
LASRELDGERIGRWYQSSSCRLRLRLLAIEMQRCRYNRRGDKGEARRPAECRDVEQMPTHQWNICAEPA